MRYPLLSTVTRAGSTGEQRRRRNPYTEVHADGDRVAYWRDPRRTQVTVISRDTRPDNPRRGRRNPATDAPPEYWDLLRQADALYSEIYRIRQRHFQPTHLGLGTWGRHLPLGEQAAARVRDLQRARSRLLSRARTLKRRPERARAGGANPRRQRRNPVALTRVRVIPSHSGLARFRAQLDERPIGSIPRQVATPYAYAQTHVVWRWRGVPVIIAETRHRRYEVFRVEGPIGPVERDNPIWVEWTAPDRWTGRPRQRKALWSRHVTRRRERGAAAFVERQRRDPEVSSARWYTTSPRAQRNPRPLPPGSKLETLRRIVAQHQQMRVGAEGSVDAMTAGAILAVYDALGPANQAKYLAMPVRRMADVAWKLLRKNPARARRRGRFCSQRVADPRRFDRRSFRTVVARGHRVTVGCPKGAWDPRRRRCRTATRAQRMLHPAGEGRCPLGGRELNPPAALCALCQREPRAPVSPYCAKCLARIHGRRNPPRGGVVIYDRLLELRAVKGRRSRFPGERFKHRFTSRAKVIGLPDGSVLLKGPRPLWKRVEV